MIEIYFDGACEPINPRGTASYGYLIKKDGEIIKEGDRDYWNWRGNDK